MLPQHPHEGVTARQKEVLSLFFSTSDHSKAIVSYMLEKNPSPPLQYFFLAITRKSPSARSFVISKRLCRKQTSTYTITTPLTALQKSPRQKALSYVRSHVRARAMSSEPCSKISTLTCTSCLMATIRTRLTRHQPWSTRFLKAMTW